MGLKGTETIWKFTIVICSVVAFVAVLIASYGLHLTLKVKYSNNNDEKTLDMLVAQVGGKDRVLQMKKEFEGDGRAAAQFPTGDPPTGERGYPGPPGFRGPAGQRGPVGPPGPPGPVLDSRDNVIAQPGPTGAMGAIGPAGLPGGPSFPGPRGARGSTGATGVFGFLGRPGATGATGHTGPFGR